MAAAGHFVKGVNTSMVYQEESDDDDHSIDHSQSKRRRKNSSSSRSKSKSRSRSQRSRSRSRSPSSSPSPSRSPTSPHNSLIPLGESQRHNSMSSTTRSAKSKAAEERIQEMIDAGIAKRLAESGASSPNSGEDEHYDAVMVNDIYVCVKTKLWRGVKFIATNGEEEKVAIACFEAMKPNKWTEKEWVKEYRGLVTKSVNKCRSYVIGELKKEAFSYMAKNEGTLPTLDQMLKIAERTVTTIADQLVFEWYWDEYLPKCTGNIWDWSKDKRHFETIRASKDPVTGKLHMSLPNEAFALIVFENNRSNWMEIYAKQKQSGKTVVVKNKVLSEEEAKNEHPKHFYTIDAKYKPQWSSASKGQQKFGGWSGVGLNRFLHYRTIVQEARKTARAGTLEKKVLKAVRKTHKIPEDLTLEDHLASKKRKRTRKERNEADIVETIASDEE